VLAKGDRVRSVRFGLGDVVTDCGTTAIIRFPHGIEECLCSDLQRVDSLDDALENKEWPAPIAVMSRALGEAICSVNDAWGVFARSKIALLPHQLWVCRQVNRDRPARWLVADDVGLGKTIEAGLILMPLIARGDVKRLLVLCPASLVEQWQYRMRTMFDIRLTAYSSQVDKPKADFWNSTPQVVASLQTLRGEGDGRHDRMLEAEPWDIILVDEAHHLNADEERGPTLGYKLIDKLQAAGRIRAMVFFTGTPHRGKNFGFLSLMRLLRPDLFNPRQPIEEQRPNLKHAMIRNNKQMVTDLSGNRLFQEPLVRAETYVYSPEETSFYETLTEFIVTGKAYARGLSDFEERTVMLVLIAMQKLASSSVAAIRRALHGRLNRIVAGRKRLANLERELERLRDQETDDDVDDDAVAELESKVAEQSAQVVLMSDEEPRLRELVAAADAVGAETKITKIIILLGESGPFAGRSVLLFTEYKATQSLLLTELHRRFGPGCTTFINGDERADDVSDGSGPSRSLNVRRERAAELFNSGKVRFLVSTEAGGEGIDLQSHCHSLIHVDLPWNPMRLHQRVGRLNRYGQQQRVEVFTVRNPHTVESRIWDKLNSKIEQIMRSLQQVMAQPDDLLQLILGMASPGLFREVFAGAFGQRPEAVENWFNTKTAQFGGRDAIATVRDLVGNCARFDFQKVASQMPRLDLPDLEPFFKIMLTRNGRQLRSDSDGLSFKMPDAWLDFPGARRDYSGMQFDRSASDPQKILGVGHRVFGNALRQACNESDLATILPVEVLPAPLFVFHVRDRVTGETGNVRSIVIGVQVDQGERKLLRDWEIIQKLNGFTRRRDLRRASSTQIADVNILRREIDAALRWLSERLPDLDHPFRVPEVGVSCIFAPGISDS
jgi:ERCC4-related helicase